MCFVGVLTSTRPTIVNRPQETKAVSSLSMTLTNLNIPRLGSRFAKDLGNHTNGCYGTNPVKAMPAVCIYDSNVKDKAKLKLKSGWVKGLPVGTG